MDVLLRQVVVAMLSPFISWQNQGSWKLRAPCSLPKLVLDTPQDTSYHPLFLVQRQEPTHTGTGHEGLPCFHVAETRPLLEFTSRAPP